MGAMEDCGNFPGKSRGKKNATAAHQQFGEEPGRKTERDSKAVSGAVFSKWFNLWHC